MTKKIAILAEDKSIAGGVITLREAFDYCNMYWYMTNKQVTEPLLECEIVSSNKEQIHCTQDVKLDALPLDKRNGFLGYDAIVVASALVNTEDALNGYVNRFKAFEDPIREYSETGKYITAYCSGPLILAFTGLLNHKSATCAWWISKLFEKLHPSVDVTLNQIVVKDEQFLTAGAASANINLALAIINMLCGERMATQIAKLLLVDPNRISQQPFFDFKFENRHKDKLVHKVEKWIQSHINDNFTLDNLAEEFAVSGRTLSRRFKSATGISPMCYYQKLRIEEAKTFLETTRDSIETIAHRVGYEDISAFRRAFTKDTSVSPRDYRRRFQTKTCN